MVHQTDLARSTVIAPPPAIPAGSRLAGEMQRQLNLAYLRVGRTAVLSGFHWEMDATTLRALAIHMDVDGLPTACAGLPIRLSATSGWRLDRN